MNNNIRQVIKEKGLKITHVITKTGLSKSSFYEIMNGNSMPSLENARIIANTIEVPLSELFPENDLRSTKQSIIA
ncbi:helix-turn-helix transcriptional regulator [Clostridium sp.]|uniref:helix-turn-helix domain-containing protein n=1 Tax=Clostridium sp. TaxID=1506 RepID=UPI002FC81A81